VVLGPIFPLRMEPASLSKTAARSSVSIHNRPTPRWPKAAFAHDHPRFHDARPGTHRIRHHGRVPPGTSGRAVRIQCRDFGMNIQAAMEAPRFTKLTFAGRDLQMEDRFPAEIRTALTQRDHKIEVLGNFSQQVGSSQAVRRAFSTGVNYGASDPRKDGEAIPNSNDGSYITSITHD
jgi:hypothetical protein